MSDENLRKGQTKLNYDFLDKKYKEIQTVLGEFGKEGFTKEEIENKIKAYLIYKYGRPMDTSYLAIEDDIIDMFKFVLYNEIAKRFQEGSLVFDPTLPDSNLDEMWEENMEAIHGRLANLPIEDTKEEFDVTDHYSKVKGILIEPRTNQVDMDDGNSLPFVPPTESTIGRKP